MPGENGNPVNKNQGWEPIHWEYKANENTSRHQPKTKRKWTKIKDNKEDLKQKSCHLLSWSFEWNCGECVCNIKYEKKQKTFKVLFLIRVIKRSWVWLMIYCSILEEHHLLLKIVTSKLTKGKERGKWRKGTVKIFHSQDKISGATSGQSRGRCN